MAISRIDTLILTVPTAAIILDGMLASRQTKGIQEE